MLPARVLHNWDFEEHGVSRQAKQFLALMKAKPVLNLELLNPHLFKFVEELSMVKVRACVWVQEAVRMECVWVGV